MYQPALHTTHQCAKSSTIWLSVIPDPFIFSVIITHIQSWDSFQSSASTSTMYQRAHVESRLYSLFKFEFNQLLIFSEKFSPLAGFEPGTSPVPNRYATNWAILAWIGFVRLTRLKSWGFKYCKLFFDGPGFNPTPSAIGFHEFAYM